MRNLFIKAIEKYQKYISPVLKSRGINCKYYPSCSEYTKQAIKKYGCIIGVIKGIFRSIINLNIISGHDYIEIYNNKDIQVLRCELCGHISVGFKAGDN